MSDKHAAGCQCFDCWNDAVDYPAPAPPAVPPDEEAARKWVLGQLRSDFCCPECDFGEVLNAYAAAVRASAITHAVNGMGDIQIGAVRHAVDTWRVRWRASEYDKADADFKATVLRALTGGAA